MCVCICDTSSYLYMIVSSCWNTLISLEKRPGLQKERVVRQIETNGDACTPLQSVHSDVYPCSPWFSRQSVEFSQVLPAALVLKAAQPHAFWPSFVLIYPLPSFGPLLITDLYENPPGSSCQELQLQVQSLGLQIARLCQAVRGSDDDDDPIADVNITRRVWILPGHRPVPVKMQRCWGDLNQLLAAQWPTKPLICPTGLDALQISHQPWRVD